MQFSPHKPHNVPERFAASVAKVCTTADYPAVQRGMIDLSAALLQPLNCFESCSLRARCSATLVAMITAALHSL